MKFKRFFALALAALLVMNLFAGCSKNSDTPGSKTDSSGSLIDQTKPAATTAKYAYQADYLDLQLPENIQYVNTMCTAGTTIFLTAYVQGDEIVQTDPDTGDTWSYYTQELILLSVDPDTGACTQLPNLQLPTVPEDCEGNVDCYNMAGSDDGTLWMLVNVYAAKYDLPADFDPNTMNKYDYPSTDMSTAYLMHVAADGSTIANVDLSVTDDGTDEEDGMGSNISSFAVDAAGNLYVTDYNYIYVLDAEGKLLFKIDDSQYSGSLCRLQPDQVGILWYNYATDTAESTDENGQFFIPVDLETKTWGEKSSDTTAYQLIVLHRIDASEVKEKTVLTLACMGLDWSLRSKIVEYNKSNDQYRIQVVDYSEYATDDDYNAGITKLTTEIISGSVPDLFLTSSLPIDKYAAKGVVADLYTFMDGGSGLSRDYFVPQVLKAIEKDGKLYELPTKFSVETAYALSSIVDQYDTWNVAAVQDAMTQLQEGATVFSTGWTKSSVLNNCLTRNLAAFVDWTTGKCTFDSEAFQQLLAFCNSFPDDSSSDDGIAYSSAAATVDTMDDPVWESDATRILSGKQLMATTSFYSFEDYIYNIYPVKDKVTFVGYPSESGEPGNSFYIQCPMAISSVTKYPDAAWDFVSTMIRQTNEDAESMYAFPISQEAFDKKMTSVMTEQYQLDVNGEQVDWDEDGEPDKMCIGTYEVVENGESTWQQVYALTQEDIDQILSVINSATGIVDYDDEILSIVSDEVSAYFAGDKDVQTTANMIQSRVNLYVQEQR